MSLLNELPFSKISNIELVSTLQSPAARINSIIENNNFQKFIKKVTHKGECSSCSYHDEDSLCTVLNKNDHNISLLHLNIRSLDKHFAELTALLNCFNHNFDVIALTEIGKKNIASRA